MRRRRNDFHPVPHTNGAEVSGGSGDVTDSEKIIALIEPGCGPGIRKSEVAAENAAFWAIDETPIGDESRLMRSAAHPVLSCPGFFATGRTALHEAAARGDVAMVRLLLDVGADANAVTAEQEKPMHLAVRNGAAAVVQLLVEHGA